MPLNDLCIQRNQNLMTFETETSGCVFGDLFVSVPVLIRYAVEHRNGFQVLQDVTIRIAGIHEYPWEDLPMYEQEAWRRKMIDAWNRKYGLMLQRATA